MVGTDYIRSRFQVHRVNPKHVALLNLPNSERAAKVEELIEAAVTADAAVGAAVNLGGFIVTAAASIAEMYYEIDLHVRLFVQIAYASGVNLAEEDELHAVCVVYGMQHSEFVKELGKVALTGLLVKFPAKYCMMVNKLVGKRVMTKAGKTGFVNVMSLVPYVGSFVGAAVNYHTCKSFGKSAKNYVADMQACSN